jgi:hypothetical protein
MASPYLAGFFDELEKISALGDLAVAGGRATAIASKAGDAARKLKTLALRGTPIGGKPSSGGMLGSFAPQIRPTVTQRLRAVG